MANKSRKPVSPKIQTEILRQSRRRCCVCFGLHRDDSVKKGQIAHLDQDPSNAESENLAWMCLTHHDEYDSKTSQSKSLQLHEVKAYRQELYDMFAHWGSVGTAHQFLNFLASSISIDDMVTTAVKAATRYQIYPEILLHEALIETDYESIDGDRWAPYLALMEDLRAWGWLDFDAEEIRSDDMWCVRVKVQHKPVCKELVLALERRFPKLAPKKELRQEGAS